jgi:hypothetical protein
LRWRHLRRACFPTPAAKLCRRRFDRIGIVGFLAGRDPHDADGVADHVSGAFLSARASRHLVPVCGYAASPQLSSLEMLDQPTAPS